MRTENMFDGLKLCPVIRGSDASFKHSQFPGSPTELEVL